MNGVLARFLPWFAVPLATIVTLRAIDAYRWVGIGAVLSMPSPFSPSAASPEASATVTTLGVT